MGFRKTSFPRRKIWTEINQGFCSGENMNDDYCQDSQPRNKSKITGCGSLASMRQNPHQRDVQWATKVMTLTSIRNTWKQGSWLLRPTVHFSGLLEKWEDEEGVLSEPSLADPKYGTQVNFLSEFATSLVCSTLDETSIIFRIEDIELGKLGWGRLACLFLFFIFFKYSF